MISEQSAAVKAALLRNPVTAEFVNRYPSNATGRDLYHFLVQAAQKKNPTFSNSQSAENASKQLLAVGVPGLTCLSYSSNGKPTGARNFVVFDDSQIYITQPGEGLAVYSQERVGVPDRVFPTTPVSCKWTVAVIGAHIISSSRQNVRNGMTVAAPDSKCRSPRWTW